MKRALRRITGMVACFAGVLTLILAFTSAVGSLAKPVTLQPIVAAVNLTTPFTFSKPAFFSYLWTGDEPPGGYLLFVAAGKPGALLDNRIDAGDIVAVSTAAVTFAP